MKSLLFKNKYMRAGIAYTIGSYLLKGLGFITVPIFARLLSTSDFGIYNTFLSYEGILYLFIGLCFHVSIKNAKVDFSNEELNQYCSNISVIPVIIAGVLLILGNLFWKPICSLLQINAWTLNLLIFYSFGFSIIQLYQARQTVDYEYKNYLKISYMNALSSILLSILFIMTIFTEIRYIGRILGNVIPVMIISIGILLLWYKENKPKWNNQHIRYAMKISLPIIPHGLGQTVLLSFDRIMISNMIGNSESGIYSFSYTLFSILQITSNALFSVFEPWVYKEIQKNKKAKVQEISSLLFFALCVLVICVMCVSPELIFILGGEQYREAIYTVIPVLVGGVISMAYGIPSILEYYYKKTHYIAIGTMGAAIVNLVLNYIFINKYGYIAAAYTTAFSYAIYFIFHSIISYKIGNFKMLSTRNVILGFSVVVAVAVIVYMNLNNMLIRGIALLFILMITGVVFYLQYRKLTRCASLNKIKPNKKTSKK